MVLQGRRHEVLIGGGGRVRFIGTHTHLPRKLGRGYLETRETFAPSPNFKVVLARLLIYVEPIAWAL